MGSTVLEKFIDGYGDQVLRGAFGVLYESPVTQAIIFIAGLLMFIDLGRNLHKKKLTGKVISFWIVYVSFLPVNNSPFAFSVISVVGKTISKEMVRVTHEVFRRAGSMPPGFIIDVIDQVNSGPLRRPENIHKLKSILRYCVPENAVNLSGEKIEFIDVISPVIRRNQLGSANIDYNFNPEILKQRYVPLGKEKKDAVNCHTYAKEFHLGVQREIKQRVDVKSQIHDDYLNSSKSSKSTQHLHDVALTASELNAKRHTVSNLLFGPSKEVKDFGGMRVNGLVEGMANQNWVTSIVTTFTDLPRKAARLMSLEGAVDSGSKAQELSEKMNDMPYYFTYIMLLMKIIFPFLLVASFLQGTKYLKIWSQVFILLVITPFLVQIAFYASNSIIYKVSGIERMVDSIERNMHSRTGRGKVRLQSASTIIYTTLDSVSEDATRMTNVIVTTLKTIIGFLMLGIPGSSWLASKKQDDRIFKAGTDAAKSVLMTASGGAASTVAARALVSTNVGEKLAEKATSLGAVRQAGRTSNAIMWKKQRNGGEAYPEVNRSINAEMSPRTSVTEAPDENEEGIDA